MIVRQNRKAYRHEIESDLPKDCTADQVLDCIFGDYDSDYRGYCDFQIHVWEDDKKTTLHRLNMFWAIPLTLVLSPLMYIKNGQIGWDDRSALGRFILRVTGHLK